MTTTLNNDCKLQQVDDNFYKVVMKVKYYHRS